MHKKTALIQSGFLAATDKWPVTKVIIDLTVYYRGALHHLRDELIINLTL